MAGLVRSTPEHGGLLVLTDRPGNEINRLLGDAGLWLDQLVPVRQDLESFFLDLTASETLRPGHGVSGPARRPTDGVRSDGPACSGSS